MELVSLNSTWGSIYTAERVIFVCFQVSKRITIYSAGYTEMNNRESNTFSYKVIYWIKPENTETNQKQIRNGSAQHKNIKEVDLFWIDSSPKLLLNPVFIGKFADWQSTVGGKKSGQPMVIGQGSCLTIWSIRWLVCFAEKYQNFPAMWFCVSLPSWNKFTCAIQ